MSKKWHTEPTDGVGLGEWKCRTCFSSYFCTPKPPECLNCKAVRRSIATACLQGIMANSEMQNDILKLSVKTGDKASTLRVAIAVELADALLLKLEREKDNEG